MSLPFRRRKLIDSPLLNPLHLKGETFHLQWMPHIQILNTHSQHPLTLRRTILQPI